MSILNSFLIFLKIFEYGMDRVRAQTALTTILSQLILIYPE